MPGIPKVLEQNTKLLETSINELKDEIVKLKDSNVKLHTSLHNSNLKWTIANLVLVSCAIMISGIALIRSSP